MKLHNDLIMELPNFVPEDLCNFIIDKFERDSNKYVGQIKYGDKTIIDKTLKDSMELDITNYCPTESNSKLWYDTDNIIEKYIGRGCKIYSKYLDKEYPGPNNCEYKQKFRTFESILKVIDKFGVKDNGYTIQRQSMGVKYGWHYDSLPDSFLFGILYLNTLTEDEGGCTEFINGRKIRPEAGKIMLSPAHWSYAHCGNEVKSVYKYTIPFITNLRDN